MSKNIESFSNLVYCVKDMLDKVYSIFKLDLVIRCHVYKNVSKGVDI